MHPVVRIIKVVSETIFRNYCSRCFIHILSQHVSAYLIAILRRIVQIIQRSYYSYNGSIVFSTHLIMHVSRRQLLLFLLCITFKYFLKIFC
jgi:hypothetical protein